MARCAYCKTAILFGGVRDGNERYCNKRCHENGFILKVTAHVPYETILSEAGRLHQGPCPKCGGPGPVDVHRVHRVWSAGIITSWHHFSVVACRGCARKSQAGGIFFCFFLGWWGIPWGFILTPIQITRNIVGMCAGPDGSRPSPDLENFVRTAMGVRMIQQQQQSPPGAPPVIVR
jgi:hypothetical protein